jgi:hypothetical protein
LVIQSLLTNKVQRYPHVIQSSIPEDEAFGRILPFTFRDDGERIYFTGTDEKTHKDLNFYYDWKALKVVAWSPPEEVTGWTGFNASDDNMFRFYYNGGLFKEGKSVIMPDEIGYGGGIWLPHTHFITGETFKDGETIITLLDVDTMSAKTIIEHLPMNIIVYSASPDGTWLNLGIKSSE